MTQDEMGEKENLPKNIRDVAGSGGLKMHSTDYLTWKPNIWTDKYLKMPQPESIVKIKPTTEQ